MNAYHQLGHLTKRATTAPANHVVTEDPGRWTTGDTADMLAMTASFVPVYGGFINAGYQAIRGVNDVWNGDYASAAGRVTDAALGFVPGALAAKGSAKLLAKAPKAFQLTAKAAPAAGKLAAPTLNAGGKALFHGANAFAQPAVERLGRAAGLGSPQEAATRQAYENPQALRTDIAAPGYIQNAANIANQFYKQQQ